MIFKTLMDENGGDGGDGGGGAGGGDQGGAGGGASGQQAPWHGLTDPEGVAYVTSKGWKSPADVVNSYRGSEKLLGRRPEDLLVLPKPGDEAGFRAAMTKLGLPESPDKYEFVHPDGLPVDPKYETWAKQTFHELGLPAQVAKALSQKHSEYVKSVIDQQHTDHRVRLENDKKALLGEWKGGHERMMNMARTAAKAFDFSPEVVDAIENTVGYANTMKLFANMGQKLGEDNFVSGAGGDGQKFNATMTPAEAQTEWQNKLLDIEFRKALTDKGHPGHLGAVQKQTELFNIMYG